MGQAHAGKSCSIDIKAEQFTATTFIEMEFCNPNEQEIEGLYRFRLEPGQIITAFQLDLHGKYRDGSIEEKWKATNAYNTIVGKRIDPALLTMEYNNYYNLRIYPVPAKGCRKITMTIQQLLMQQKEKLSYSLPMAITDTVQHFKLNIAVQGNGSFASGEGILAGHNFNHTNSGQYLSYTKTGMQLKEPLSFSLATLNKTVFCSKPVGEVNHFALRYKPSVTSVYKINPQKLTVFWDASASVAKRDLNKDVNFLKQFIAFHNISQLTIIPFNHKLLDTAVFYTKNGFSSQWQQYLKNIKYDGATQLGVIDCRGKDKEMIMLFSDGNNSYGKSLPLTGNSLVYCISSTNTADKARLQLVAGASGGKLIELGKISMSEAINMAGTAENWLLNITSSSGKIIVEQDLPMKWQPSLFINGTLHGDTDTLKFHFGNNNEVNSTETILVNKGEVCPLSAIDRIKMFTDYSQVINTYNWNRVLDFGLQEKVVTPYTAYIVLERVEDYVKYNIAPPKELEEECKQLNYVKRDTRFERTKLEEADTYSMLNNIIVQYNERMRVMGSTQTPIVLTRTEFERSQSQATVTIDTKPASAPVSQLPTGGEGNALQEVVVTAVGMTRKEKALGYASTRLVAADLLLTAPTIEQALQGRVAGVQITNSQGVPGSGTNIAIRGTSSLINGSQPLYVLDGVPVSGDINQVIRPLDIENVTVLRSPSAAALYGSRAANGAVVIVTKRGRNNYNYYNNRPYRLKDMEDVDYLAEIKQDPVSAKMGTYLRLQEQYGGETSFYFDMAQHLYESGLVKEAGDVLMNGAESSNGSQQVLTAMAYILESWNRYDEAKKLYEEMLKDNPFSLTLRRDLAWACYQQGQYQEAIDTLYAAITLKTEQHEQYNVAIKSIMLNELNAIIASHKAMLNLSAIPAAIIRPLDVDMRVTLESNMGNLVNVRINEPGNQTCSYHNPLTKNGGYTQSNNYRYWSDNIPFEYQVKTAREGKYKVRVNAYNYNRYANKVPSIIRLRVFKNFGRAGQSIAIENIVMDNQEGDVEIAELKW